MYGGTRVATYCAKISLFVCKSVINSIQVRAKEAIVGELSVKLLSTIQVKFDYLVLILNIFVKILG